MTAQKILTGMRRIRKMYESCMTSVLQRHDLTAFEADILGFLSNNPDMDTANHIVEYRMLPKANVSKAVDRLKKRGLITLHRDNTDRRRIHLALTEAATPIAENILDAQARFGSRLTKGFTPEEKRLFADFLCRINNNASDKTEEN